MANPLKQGWLFSIHNRHVFSEFSTPVSSGEMPVPGNPFQKFHLEFFRRDAEISFHVRCASGRIDLNMKVSIMQDQSELKSTGWIAVNTSIPFYLMTTGELRDLHARFQDTVTPVRFRCDVETPCGSQVEEDLRVCELDYGKKDRARLVDDLAKVVSKDAQFSDITLICQDRRFASYKVLLAARSDVFAAMFSHKETAEASTGSVEITDMEPDILEKMLQFIYTDQLGAGVSYPCTCKLLVAADKYNIHSLTAVCEHFIGKYVSVLTAVEALTAAYLCGSEMLKSLLLDFAKKNMPQLRDTSEWREIMEAKNGVALEIIKDLLEYYIAMDTTDKVDK